MFFYINFFFIFLIHFTIKIFFNLKKITFKKIIFIYLFFLSILIAISIKKGILGLNINNQLNYLYILINLLIFLSYILTIGLKTLDSPTFYILEYIKKNKQVKIELLEKYLQEKQLLQIRFQKLHEENLIQYKNNEIVLTLSGKFFIRFMNIFSKSFNITNEG